MRREEHPSSGADLMSASSNKKRSIVLFVFLLALFIVATLFTNITTRSTDVLVIGGSQLPVTSLAGIFSSLANLIAIFVVVFFGKLGFVTSLSLLILQIPMLVMGMITQRNLTSIPGFFGIIFTIIMIIMIYRRNRKIERFQTIEISYLKEQQQFSQRLFEQTAKALVNAIDAKDKYSHGHSMRVAEYSEKIARAMGKNDEECYQIYYAALLHDVGKIGIQDTIIRKDGRLTDEEYEAIKQHPVFGNQILASISEYPYLSIGAHFHHERYDGKGYPDKLKGEDIPEIARIIAVADAYDAMTSSRSYRNAIPQQTVREEIVKNAGTQFDPEVAKIMQHIIDLDTEYQMKERTTVAELAGRSEIRCKEYRSEISEGIVLMPNLTRIRLTYTPDAGREEAVPPTIVLFDSLDGRVHKDERMQQELYYFEYCEIRFDGVTVVKGARKIFTNILETKCERENNQEDGRSVIYDLEAVRYDDHVLIRIDDGKQLLEVTVALPDSARYSYIGLTGEYCHISDVHISNSEKFVQEGYITRIAEKISYIRGPEGDIPNVQIDGYRRTSTKGIPISNGLTITFHTMSLPTARLIWHCPYFVIFHSGNGEIGGKDYRDYALIRIDGENWEGDGKAENNLLINKTDAFQSWDEWKKINKAGFDVTVTFERKGDTIVTTTENLGISLRNTTKILDGEEDVYVAITGDQCALTNIRIKKSK